jgi:hypothetical protein
MNMTVFWDVASFSLVEVYRRFRGVFCLHHQDDLLNSKLCVERVTPCGLTGAYQRFGRTSVTIYKLHPRRLRLGLDNLESLGSQYCVRIHKIDLWFVI